MNLSTSINASNVSEEVIEHAYNYLTEIFKLANPELYVSEELRAIIRERTHVVHFKKNEVLLKYGQVCRYCLFTMTGLVQSSFINNGEEKIVWFMGDGDIVMAVHSWYDQQPSEEQLVALQDTTGIVFSFDFVERLKSESRDFLTIVLALTEKYYTKAIQRTKWQQYSTTEKVRNLHELYGHLVRVLPVTTLASFLGITRKTYSRIVSGLFRKIR